VEAEAREAIRRKPEDPVPHFDLGYVLFRQGRCKEAEDELRASIRLNPDDTLAHDHLGLVLQQQDRYEDAEWEHREASRLKPDDPWPHGRLAGVLRRLGRHEEAYRETEEECRGYIGRDPGNAPAHNNLAWFLATGPYLKLRDPGQALTHARKAVELAPDNGVFWNTLGVAHYRNGDWQVAIESLNKSNALLKGNYLSFNGFFLAMAHWKLNEKEKARAWYDQAVAWMDRNHPQNEELQRFRAEATTLLGDEKAAESQKKPE